MIFIVYKKKGNWQLSAIDKSTEQFYVIERNDPDFPTKNSRVNHSDVALVIYRRQNAINFNNKLNEFKRDRDDYINTAYQVYNDAVQRLVDTHNNSIDNSLKEFFTTLNLVAISGQDEIGYVMSGDIALIPNLSPESLLNLYVYFRDHEEDFTVEIVDHSNGNWSLIVYKTVNKYFVNA